MRNGPPMDIHGLFIAGVQISVLGHLAERHFDERHLAERTSRRKDILPKDILPNRKYIFLKTKQLIIA